MAWGKLVYGSFLEKSVGPPLGKMGLSEDKHARAAYLQPLRGKLWKKEEVVRGGRLL